MGANGLTSLKSISGEDSGSFPIVVYGGLDLNNVAILNLGDPLSGKQAANKDYVDSMVGNINSALDAINGEVV